MTDHKNLNIGTIIACRLKSTRLPKKALLKIGSLSSVEYCIKNTLEFKGVKTTVLATSTVKEDDELSTHTYSPEVKFFQGQPDDVMQRYVDVVNKYNIDLFARVTADMPFVSDEIFQVVLKSHLENNADYTIGTKAAIGTNLEIINSDALRRAKSFFPNADYSEYMSFYFTNNPEHFKLNKVDLPADLVRDYRLTLDYEEDLTLFNIIDDYFTKNNTEPTLRNIIDFLDAHPKITKINQSLAVKYKDDKTLIDTLNRVTKIPAK
jgi:spore coat polysaccharide biosynthesis protein SpsF (cytidylyltransferase family)